MKIWRATEIACGALAPSFSLPRVNGAGRVGQQIGDGRPAVILFFASWCGICHTELPSLAGVISRQQHSTGALHKIQVLGVDPLDPPNAANGFVKSAHVVFPTGPDSTSHVLADQYGFIGPPYAVFIYAASDD
jgi:peroxiredoxin